MKDFKTRDYIMEYTVLDYVVVMEIELEDYQLDLLYEFFENKDLNEIQINKSRQVGLSFLVILYMLIMAQLRSDVYGLIISYRQKNSKELIQEIKKLYDKIPDYMKHTLKTDNALELAFSNGSIIRADSCTQVRGFPSNNFMIIVLDEFAFWKNDYKFLEAIQGGFVRYKPHSSVIVISTPFGTSNAFYKLWHTKNDYKKFEIKWWNYSGLVREGIDKETGRTFFELAQEQAPLMTTQQRVYKFGNERLIKRYRNMFTDSFKQEFEADFTANSRNLISLEDVKKVLKDDLICSEEDLEETVNDLVYNKGWKINVGLDLSTGNSTDFSSICIIATKMVNNIKRHKLVFYKKIKDLLINVEEYVEQLYLNGIITSCTVDERGVGFSVWQNLNQHKNYGNAFRKFNSTQQRNIYSAYTLRDVIAKKRIILENDLDLITDLCNIKVEKNNGKEKIVFKRDLQKGHCDIASSLFMALYDEKLDDYSLSELNNLQNQINMI